MTTTADKLKKQLSKSLEKKESQWEGLEEKLTKTKFVPYTVLMDPEKLKKLKAISALSNTEIYKLYDKALEAFIVDIEKKHGEIQTKVFSL